MWNLNNSVKTGCKLATSNESDSLITSKTFLTIGSFVCSCRALRVAFLSRQNSISARGPLPCNEHTNSIIIRGEWILRLLLQHPCPSSQRLYSQELIHARTAGADTGPRMVQSEGISVLQLGTLDTPSFSGQSGVGMWSQKLLQVVTMKETSPEVPPRRKPSQRGDWNQEIYRETQLDCQSPDQTVPETSIALWTFQ